MAYYMIQVTYKPEAWAALLKHPSSVIERNRALIESAGGKVIGGWFAFGQYDTLIIVELPDNVSMAAVAMLAISGGAGTALHTTPLMSMEEGIAAMEKAGSLPYTRPGG